MAYTPGSAASPLLIGVDELADAMFGSRSAVAAPIRLLDVRWSLGDATGRDDYLTAHIPGAVYVDLDTELADPPSPAAGRHPLPSHERLAAAVRRWGIDAGDRVIAYDGDSNLCAARAWWVLTNAGLPRVQLLDGALPAWRAAGLPLESGQVAPVPGTATLDATNRLAVIAIERAAALPAHGVLLDARSTERYLGLSEPIDPRAGHIPGAVSAPTGENVDDDGRFLPPDVLRQRFENLGVREGAPTAAYCGSGVTAAHEVFALRLAGFDAALYAGSWSQWSQTTRPAATQPLAN
ncbi:MAG: sulfurtransferase [Bifidobacteriaceae bacterium]|jgi:thiosulfate/3-mercaptopyruvate sulfurtransferase|nr:sulfurtransferase [Bifidobacteriaceae bacterium]